MRELLRVHPGDNVLVAVHALAAGDVDGITLRSDVPAGHKVAARAIAAGEPVVKYGHPIGVASRDIEPGEHVHSHNAQSALTETLEAKTFRANSAPAASRAPLTFDGYRRADGRAATRNEIWIVNLVGCVNHASTRIAELAGRELEGTGVDGVHAFPHPFGCSQLGDDLKHTQQILAGLARHPNAAGVLVLGLGCENNQMKAFLEELGGSVGEDRLRYFNAQEVEDEIDAGIQAVHELAAKIALSRREPIDVSELIVAMKCGGSDGFSGITANPLVGRVADRLTAAGATVVLSEVPEMFGAEDLLLDRAADEATFDETVAMLQSFRDYFHRHGERVDENPSPGNKAGGITTLAEKSLGCVQKGGRAPVKQVVSYGGQATPGLGGLALVNSPGNDGVSCTAMTVAGAGVLLFTTGRGTPMGFPAPTIKISSNSDLAARKPRWIDFDAGPVAEGTTDLDTLGDDLLAHVLDVASGRKLTRNEDNRYREIAIWKGGVTL